MIVVTGAAGFIASCMVAYLNECGYKDVVAVDDFSKPQKNLNLDGKQLSARIHRDEFIDWLAKNENQVQFVIHLGARTDTTEFDTALLTRLNLDYSKAVWQKCVEYGLPLIYASSAATYGDGQLGFTDDVAIIPSLLPLNPYGVSKNEFDKWVLLQTEKPYFWAGFKFFNVYGPNEYHKGRMASVVLHTFNQIKQHGSMKLFRSHNPAYKDGEQLRDFVYVRDVCKVLLHFMETRKHNGIYNLGSGQARTFLDLANAVFASLGKAAEIEFIDTPADIRDKYQYYTQAEMGKLAAAGCPVQFTPLEAGVDEYVKDYLVTGGFF
ncbi:MAG: ADP-glyceromanno-heptose 6-epimerase [Flavobacteriaceae bacterium]|nr:ADP-glyceromanno-heptose 6-epimerase [Flavobacteriaceae bacterium]